MKKDAWTIFDECFKNGDEVVVILDNDTIYWGTLILHQGDAKNKIFDLFNRVSGKETNLHWENVLFISHDGFPVKKLTGADGSQLIEQIDTTNTQTLIRKALTHNLCDMCGKKVENLKFDAIGGDHYLRCQKCELGEQRRKSFTFGDPFIVEGVTGEIINTGNAGPRFWNSDYEECLVLESKDRAKGILYDIPHIYYFVN